jgi:hypothetical protein
MKHIPQGPPYINSIENTFPHVNQRIYELVQAVNDANRRIENLEHLVRFLAAHYDGGKPPVQGLAKAQVDYLDAVGSAAELRSRALPTFTKEDDG